MSQRPNITDWIQAIAVLAGVLFAVQQISFADGLSKRDQAKFAADLISKGSEAHMIESMANIVRLEKSPRVAGLASFDVLVEMTPITELMIQWAICYDERLCNRRIALDHACPIAVYAETAAEGVFKKYDIPFDISERRIRKFEFWDKCMERAT